MPNAFDRTEYPETEPERIVAGDRLVWKRTDLGIDYPPASYALRYVGRLFGTGATEIAIDAVESGTDYFVEEDSSTTAAWTAGRYAMQAYIIRSSDTERLSLKRWTLEVLADRDESTADPRSWAHVALDAVRAVIQTTATKEQQTFVIEGISLSRRSLTELLSFERRLARAVAREEATKRRQAGKGAGTRVRARMA